MGFLTKHIDKKLGSFLVMGFFLFTIIGTLTHEVGHYTFARLQGYEVKIHSDHCTWYDVKDQAYLDSNFNKYSRQIENGLAFPSSEKFYETLRQKKNDGFWITLGGPLETILTGTFGFIFILWNKQKFLSAKKLNLIQWIFVFLTFFWVRQIVNFLMVIGVYLINGKFSARGDEVKLALHFGLPQNSIYLITSAMALVILSITFFKFIPKNQRLTLLLSGLIGGVLGAYFWLHAAGPLMMP